MGYSFGDPYLISRNTSELCTILMNISELLQARIRSWKMQVAVCFRLENVIFYTEHSGKTVQQLARPTRAKYLIIKTNRDKKIFQGTFAIFKAKCLQLVANF